MESATEKLNTKPKNKIKTYTILIAAAITLAGFAWYFAQQLPWFPNKSSHSLPMSGLVKGSWQAFYPDQGIMKGEAFEDWSRRIQQKNPDHWEFWLTQLQGIGPEMAYPLLKGPYVDSLIKDVAVLWGSDQPEIKSAKSSLFEVISRHQSLQKFTDSFIQENSKQASKPNSPGTVSKSTKPLEVIAMVGLFQYQTALTDSSLWVGLDMFMNEEYRYYPSVEHLYQYQRRRTAPGYMPVAAARTLAEDWVNENLSHASESENSLLDQIIREGQTLACMRWLLPEIHDSLLLGYSAAQWNWIKSNQDEVWRDMVSKDFLFESDPAIISRFMNDGPFSSGYPQESPPALGRFIGDALIQKWIQSNKDSQKSPPWIMLLKNGKAPSSQILKKSGYKGRS